MRTVRTLLAKPSPETSLLALQLLAVAAIAAFVHDQPGLGAETDFVLSYGPQAQAALSGELMIDDFRGPLYPLLVAGIAALCRVDVFRAGVWLSVAASLGATALILALGRQLAGRRVALLMAASCLVSVSFLGLAFVATTDMVFLCLSLLIVYLSTRCVSASGWFIVGAVSGLLLLLRYNAIALLFAAALVIVLRLQRERPTAWARLSALRLAAYLAGVALLVVPWGLYTLETKGAFLYNKNYLNLAFSFYGQDDWETFFYPGPRDIGASQHSFASLAQVLTHRPTAVLGAVLRGLVFHPWEDLRRLLGLHLALLLVPLPWSIRAIGASLRSHPLGVFSLVYFVSMAPMFYTARLYLVLLPAYAYILAHNACVFYAWAARSVFWRRSALAYAGGTVLLALLHQAHGWSDDPHELQTLAARLQTTGADLRGQRTIARKPHLCFKLACQHIDLPKLASLDELTAYMCEQKAAYLLHGPSEQRQRPALAVLAEPERVADVFTLVASATGVRSARLYRLDLGSCASSWPAPVSWRPRSDRGERATP